MFDQSFEEWFAVHLSKYPSKASALHAWRLESIRRWQEVVSSSHWHGGVPCAQVPSCKRFQKHSQTMGSHQDGLD